MVLQLEDVDLPCEASVLITNDSRLRVMNKEFRGIDKSTDVLSFPMQTFSPPGWDRSCIKQAELIERTVMLGDIALSAQHVILQAREYMQTCEQETAYLIVHSVLHLLGYDHDVEPEGTLLMRERERVILAALKNSGLLIRIGNRKHDQ
jgi:probable rRNA maturation factor